MFVYFIIAFFLWLFFFLQFASFLEVILNFQHFFSLILTDDHSSDFTETIEAVRKARLFLLTWKLLNCIYTQFSFHLCPFIMNELLMLWDKGKLSHLHLNPSLPGCCWVLLLKLSSLSWSIQVAFSVQFFPSSLYTCFKIPLLQTTTITANVFPTSLALTHISASFYSKIPQKSSLFSMTLLSYFLLSYIWEWNFYLKKCVVFIFLHLFFKNRTNIFKHKMDRNHLTTFFLFFWSTYNRM